MEGILIPVKINVDNHFFKACVDVYVNLHNEKSKGDSHVSFVFVTG